MRVNKKIFSLILFSISLILTQVSKYNPRFAEWYATTVYPIFPRGIGSITNIFNFSIAEIFVIAMILGLLIYIAITVIKSVKGNTSKYIKVFLLNTSLIVTVLYFLFVLFCGINYHRYEFKEYSGLEIKKSSKAELVNLCERLINQSNSLRTKVNTNINNVVTLNDNSYYRTSERAKESFDKLSNDYKILKGNYPRPKPVFFSKVMSYMNITGIFFPFTFESNINIDIPSYQIPSIMCHELSHLRGFMREDEANFISYLACMNSEYDDFKYSATMNALTYSMNALYLEDYDAFKIIYNIYSEDVLKDIKFTRNYWDKYRTKISEVSNKVNDIYLKANNQIDGVKSYGRMVDLLLAYYR